MSEGGGRERLGPATLARVPSRAAPPIGGARIETGLVHIGLGGFARGFLTAYTQDAIASSGGGWGICGVAPSGGEVLTGLREQGGLYTLLERGQSRDEPRVIAALTELIDAGSQPDRLADRIADPAVGVVTLTVTEAGYPRDSRDGSLDRADPRLERDLRGGPPRSALGILRRGLERRAELGSGPLTIVSCDNVPDNGGVLRELLLELCEALGDDALGAWVEREVAFPRTVVDRIVPTPRDSDRAAAAEALGLTDAAPVAAEPRRWWVLEDRFAGPIPDWRSAGALIVDDVAPYAELKLRVFNGGHSMLAALGILAGFTTVAEAAADEEIAAAVRAMIGSEVGPTLALPRGIALDEYADEVFERWSNRRIEHRLEQIAAGAEEKLRVRLVPAAEESNRAGRATPWIELAIAATIEVESRADGDEDPLEPGAAAERALERVGCEIAPEGVAEALGDLRSGGVAKAIAERGGA